MTDGEAKGLVAILAVAYRQALADVTDEIYCRSIQGLPFDVAMTVIERLITISKFFPSIAEIRMAVVDQMVALPTPEEAWHQVSRLLGEFPASPDTAWSPTFSPHPLVCRVVKDLGGLWDLSHSENAMADRAHFLRLFEDLRGKIAIDAAIDPSGCVDALRAETAKIEDWREKAAQAVRRTELALLPPPVKSPPPAGFHEQLRALIRRKFLQSASEAEEARQ